MGTATGGETSNCCCRAFSFPDIVARGSFRLELSANRRQTVPSIAAPRNGKLRRAAGRGKAMPETSAPTDDARNRLVAKTWSGGGMDDTRVGLHGQDQHRLVQDSRRTAAPTVAASASTSATSPRSFSSALAAACKPFPPVAGRSTSSYRKSASTPASPTRFTTSSSNAAPAPTSKCSPATPAPAGTPRGEHGSRLVEGKRNAYTGKKGRPRCGVIAFSRSRRDDICEESVCCPSRFDKCAQEGRVLRRIGPKSSR